MINHVVKGKSFNCAESNINLLADGGYYFVDKTLTINQFLTGPSPHQIVLRPRRCGKSHAISLLKTFLEAPSPNEDRPATLEAPFKGTLIDGEDYKDIVNKHYKAHPILYINLKDVKGMSLDGMYQELHSSLWSPLSFCLDEFKRQKKDDIPLYNDLWQLIDQQGNWSEMLEEAPFLISEALNILYGRPAIVLVDEYETPLDFALQYNYLPSASIFFRNMFSRLLKDNPYVQRSFMVGILKVATSGWISGLNNVEVFSLNARDPQYGDSFLFTEQEIREFLDKTGSSLKLAELKEYYSCYYARGPGGTSTSLFNPWSIHHAIAHNELACYWNQTSSYMPIRKAIWNRGPDFTNCLIKLFAGEEVQLLMRDTVTYEYEDLTNIQEEDLWSLLSYAGYLTPIFIEGSLSSYNRIPNFELRQEWVSWLREFIKEKEQKSFDDIKTLLNPLLQGDAVEAQKAVSKLLLEHFSYFLFGASLPENVYQAFLFGLLLSEFGQRPESYVVEMEKEAGYGRYDIRCRPILQASLQGHRTEIIIKLRAVSLSKKNKNKRVKKTKKELEKHMDQQLKIAMDQLESREYYRTSRDHVTTVHEFGICFARKLYVVGSRTRTRNGTDWTVNNYTVPGAQFQESEVRKQIFDTTVEEKLEELEKSEIHDQKEDKDAEPTSGSSSHHAAMEVQQTGAISSRKRKSSQRQDRDTESFNTRSAGPGKRARPSRDM